MKKLLFAALVIAVVSTLGCAQSKKQKSDGSARAVTDLGLVQIGSEKAGEIILQNPFGEKASVFFTFDDSAGSFVIPVSDNGTCASKAPGAEPVEDGEIILAANEGCTIKYLAKPSKFQRYTGGLVNLVYVPQAVLDAVNGGSMTEEEALSKVVSGDQVLEVSGTPDGVTPPPADLEFTGIKYNTSKNFNFSNGSAVPSVFTLKNVSGLPMEGPSSAGDNATKFYAIDSAAAGGKCLISANSMVTVPQGGCSAAFHLQGGPEELKVLIFFHNYYYMITDSADANAPIQRIHFAGGR